MGGQTVTCSVFLYKLQWFLRASTRLHDGTPSRRHLSSYVEVFFCVAAACNLKYFFNEYDSKSPTLHPSWTSAALPVSYIFRRKTNFLNDADFIVQMLYKYSFVDDTYHHLVSLAWTHSMPSFPICIVLFFTPFIYLIIYQWQFHRWHSQAVTALTAIHIIA